jgi:hypothetical protein
MKNAMTKYIDRTPASLLPAYVREWPPVVPGQYDTNHAPPECRPYSIRTRMISGLGNLLYSSAPFFNSAVKLMGITGFPLGIYAFSVLKEGLTGLANALAILGLISFEIGCVGIILLGIYTENRHFKHGITAGLSFGGYMPAILCWIYPVWLSRVIPNVFIIFHLVPIGLFFYHMVVVKHFDLHTQMQDLLPSRWQINYNLSEWLLFFGVCVWIFILFVFLVLI